MKHALRPLVFIFVAIPLFLFSGCGDKEAEKTKAKIDSLEKEVATLTALLNDANNRIEALGVSGRVAGDSCEEIEAWADSMVARQGTGVWYIGENVYPVFVKSVKNGTVETLVDEINKKFRSDKLPELLFLGNENGKVQVGVSDDRQLTSGMGSNGAQSYINAVTFTLESVPGINLVEFKFEEGDHAAPGTFSRNFVKK